MDRRNLCFDAEILLYEKQMFFVFADTTADNAAQTTMHWGAASFFSLILVREVVNRLKNGPIWMVCKNYELKYRFTPLYSPWSNGAVQLLFKKLFCVLRWLFLEKRLLPKEWTDWLPLVQSAIGNAGFLPLATFRLWH